MCVCGLQRGQGTTKVLKISEVSSDLIVWDKLEDLPKLRPDEDRDQEKGLIEMEVSLFSVGVSLIDDTPQE